MQGKLLTVIHRDPGERNGEKYDGYCQVQMMVEEVLSDGQVKHGLHTLSTDLDNEARFTALPSGSTIRVPVRAYTRGNAIAFTLGTDPVPEVVREGPRVEALVSK
jgi:hypothetical protein